MEHINKSPRYATLKAEEAQLSVALSKVNARITEVSAALASHSEEERGDAQVAAALRFSDTGVVEPLLDLRAEHLLLRSQADAVRQALKDKSAEVELMHRELSVQNCAEHIAAHRALAGKSADLLEQLDQLVDEEAKLQRTIAAAGYEPPFGCTLIWNLHGRLAEMSASNLWHRRNELRQYANQK